DRDGLAVGRRRPGAGLRPGAGGQDGAGPGGRRVRPVRGRRAPGRHLPRPSDLAGRPKPGRRQPARPRPGRRRVRRLEPGHQDVRPRRVRPDGRPRHRPADGPPLVHGLVRRLQPAGDGPGGRQGQPDRLRGDRARLPVHDGERDGQLLVARHRPDRPGARREQREHHARRVGADQRQGVRGRREGDDRRDGDRRPRDARRPAQLPERQRRRVRDDEQQRVDPGLGVRVARAEQQQPLAHQRRRADPAGRALLPEQRDHERRVRATVQRPEHAVRVRQLQHDRQHVHGREPAEEPAAGHGPQAGRDAAGDRVRQQQFGPVRERLRPAVGRHDRRQRRRVRGRARQDGQRERVRPDPLRPRARLDVRDAVARRV
ncbi:MAG: hypothetical protein AVDCRST_MAG64-2842, partial [uncultured Phycisphaerae bacterium]